jgi:hypothetical protein
MLCELVSQVCFDTVVLQGSEPYRSQTLDLLRQYVQPLRSGEARFARCGRRRQEPARRTPHLSNPLGGISDFNGEEWPCMSKRIETVLELKKYAASSMGKICGQPCQGWSYPPEAVQTTASHQLWEMIGISMVWTGMKAEKASQSAAKHH